MSFRKVLYRAILILIFSLTILNIVYYVTIKNQREYSSREVLKAFKENFVNNISNEKVSWEDLDFINYEATRVGPGEQGHPVIVTDPDELAKNQEWVKKEGFFVDVSNKISVTRSLPDHRPAVCKTQKYFQKLPNVSVIVTFHNEIPSTLLRCVHSIYNRSPKQLLHEIVLVNDMSTFPELNGTVQEYIKKTFGEKVKIIENEERQGLIKARMTGAKAATGEVIIFLDSHMEVYNSWLPPLLDPIVTNPTFATVPVVDGMNHETFAPQHVGYGFRGVFDWNFRYQWLPLRSKDKKIEGAPYELACMTGGAYAIRREHFLYLGGYDEGLLIWNGENYELSIKLWLCSGGLFEVPCARAVHLSKAHSAYRNTKEVTDFEGRNLKRVAEVWLDDYKQYFYRGNINRYKNLDPGDLTEQFKKKKSLNCKPFQYYLDEVAPEILKFYPITPQNFAAGKIQSIARNLCLGLVKRSYKKPVELFNCNQTTGLDFLFTFEESIKYNDTSDQCLNEATLNLSNCNHQRGSQRWKFDLSTRQIIHPRKNECLETKDDDNQISLSKCDADLVEQRWKWTYENTTALMDWDKSAIKID
ncbi:CLUMA_CG009258, isoform A [Clunio marinus]|uniref:Polypeptide N-acetylgalactosaminyltransferase n=1 Tax=Clunio marinus TaxID=568069 RepID=A0A1J1I7U0_9DIPT|nr:CLUMA_CG009258, isoform A [Clunio marinus]